MENHQAQGSSSKGSTRKDKGKLVALAPCKPRQKAKAMEGVTYPCPSCNQTFGNAQALGGHQNAHRREREEEGRLYRERQRAAAQLPMAPNQHGYMYGGLQPRLSGHQGHCGLHRMNMGHGVGAAVPPAVANDDRPRVLYDFLGVKGGEGDAQAKEDDPQDELDLNLHL